MGTKYYSGTHTNSSNWSTGSGVCTGGKHFTVNSTGATPYTATCASAVPTGVTAVADCEYSVVSTTSSGSTAYCSVCKKGKGGNATSTAFTTDSNCRMLASDGTCGSCWNAYYFNATV